MIELVRLLAGIYWLLLPALLIWLTVGHVRAIAPTQFSKRVIVGLTAGSVLLSLLWAGPLILNSMVQLGIGIYIVFHKMIAAHDASQRS